MLIDKELVQQKSKYIAGDIEQLRQLLEEHTHESLAADETSMTIAERRLERIINRAIDINMHLIRAADSPPPDDYTESFRAIGKIGVLTPERVKNVLPAAGARNVLAHEYDNLDMERFYSSLESAVQHFPEYLDAVSEYVEKHN